MTPTTQIILPQALPTAPSLNMASEDLEYTREVRHEALHLALDYFANAASGPADSASSVISTACTLESYLRGE